MKDALMKFEKVVIYPSPKTIKWNEPCKIYGAILNEANSGNRMARKWINEVRRCNKLPDKFEE